MFSELRTLVYNFWNASDHIGQLRILTLKLNPGIQSASQHLVGTRHIFHFLLYKLGC